MHDACVYACDDACSPRSDTTTRVRRLRDDRRLSPSSFQMCQKKKKSITPRFAVFSCTFIRPTPRSDARRGCHDRTARRVLATRLRSFSRALAMHVARREGNRPRPAIRGNMTSHVAPRAVSSATSPCAETETPRSPAPLTRRAVWASRRSTAARSRAHQPSPRSVGRARRRRVRPRRARRLGPPPAPRARRVRGAHGRHQGGPRPRGGGGDGRPRFEALAALYYLDADPEIAAPPTTDCAVRLEAPEEAQRPAEAPPPPREAAGRRRRHRTHRRAQPIRLKPPSRSARAVFQKKRCSRGARSAHA